VGKHWGNSTGEQSKTSRGAVRALAAATGLALAVLVFGPSTPGWTPVGAGQQSPPAAGSVGPGLLEPVKNPAQADRGSGLLPDAPSADGRAPLSFARTTVQTVSKDRKAVLRDASAGLSRPPKGFLMAPLETLVETSPFGLRTSPLTGTAGEFHLGQDFAAACGTRVYSADAGVVRAVGWHPWGGGNRVEIDHGNGLITTYNHLQGIAVKPGDSVGVDEVIAKVGTTGSSTGCHVHFETILNGSYTNPLDWQFLPTRQLARLDDIQMVSYAPGSGSAGSSGGDWAVPVAAGPTDVTGGAQETRVAPVPSAPALAPSASAASAKAAPTATPTPPASPKPTVTAAPTPAGTAKPAVTPAPTPTPTATPTPTPTATPTPSQTSAPKPAVTAAPTPSQTSAPKPAVTAAPTPSQTSAPSAAPAAPTPSQTSAPKPAAPAAPTPTAKGATPSVSAPAPTPTKAAAPEETAATRPTASLEPTEPPAP